MKKQETPTDEAYPKKEKPAKEQSKNLSPSRRGFLKGAGGIAAATAVGGIGLPTLFSSKAAAVVIEPTPCVTRANEAEQLRNRAAQNEENLGCFAQPTNGDEELYPNRIANFTKTMQHDDFGEVNQDDYNQLLAALQAADFDAIEGIPKGGTMTFLNPLGGWAFNMEGPDSPAVSLRDLNDNPLIPPAFASQEMAAQAAEIYWQAVCGDVPFEDYATDPLIAAAVADLNSFPGYVGTRPITPDNIFRYPYPGAEIGPMVSQFQLRDFVFNGIPINGRARFLLPVNGGDGIDFLTTFDEWLERQRGILAPQGTTQREDTELHYPRSARDLGRVAMQDNINGAFYRANLMMGGFEVDDANPYKTAQRQNGFATLGGGELPGLLGVYKGERHAWYQKWFVHRYLRPEAFGGRVHLTKIGTRNYPIDPQLLNSPVMNLIFERNRLVNQRRNQGNEGSFLLPQHGVNGGPTHPSATAGHAITSGACVTVLKAWFREDAPFPGPHWEPTRDGGRRDITGQFPLTVGGELNKLAHNLTAGRDMSGVHWRVADNISGNIQGEEVAIRLMREAKPTYPEKNKFPGFSLTRFNGQTIPHIA
jgi:hypothetical protein